MSSSQILIVEDCSDIAELEADIVALIGHHATIASDGAQALRELAATHFDLVLLDLGLPILSGQAVLDHMRDDPKLCCVPVVVISANTEQLRKSPQIVAILEKPFEYERLESLIQFSLAPND